MSNPEQNEQKTYRESLKDYWDFFSVTETAEKKGHKVGLAEGRAEGLAEGMEKGMEKGLAEGMEKGMEKGLAEGMEKGLEKGREAKSREIAAQMKQAGLPIAQIVQFTGLPEFDIESL